MTNKKSTRRSLLMSALAMLLCVSMLIGSTFAWFTDEVVSGTNIIAAGNLDVELTHADLGTAGEFKPVNGDTILFDDVALWEPGAVAYEKLTVSNVGDLALKYNLMINLANANGVLHTDGKIYTLADVLQVAVVDADKLTDREAAIAAGEEAGWNKLVSWSENGKLYDEEGKDSDTYGIVIYWEPSANDNIWNLNNGKVTTDGSKQLTIELGVHLTATQLTHENDSFNDQYDAAASVNVSTTQELINAINNAVANTVIYLAPGEYQVTGPIEINKGQTVTLYGTGDVTLKQVGGSHIFNVANSSTVTFQNLDLDGNNNQYRNGIYVRENATVTLINTSVKNTGHSDICIDQVSDEEAVVGKTATVTLINSSVEDVAACAYPVKESHSCYIDGAESFVVFTYDSTSHLGSFQKDDFVTKPENITINGSSTEPAFTMYAYNDADLTRILETIKTVEKYWKEEVVVYLAGVEFSGDHVINQYPVPNGNNTDYANKYTNITFVGDAGTVFTGNVTVTGSGYSGGAFNDHTAKTTFKNVIFDAADSIEENGKDYIALYMLGAADDVNFIGCTFRNATHITAGQSGTVNGVGEVNFNECIFNNGNCISGYVETLNINGGFVFNAYKGFINKAKAGNVTVTGTSIDNSGEYVLRTATNGSGVHATFTNVTVGAVDKLVIFRGSNESASFTDCTIPSDWSATGVDTDSTLTIYNFEEIDGIIYRTNGVTEDVMLYQVTANAPAKLVIPEGVTSLGNKILQGNTTVKEVVIPSSVKNFGGKVDSATSASGGMFYKSAVEKIVLPEGIEEIPAAAFNQAAKLTSVNIPASVKKLGINAFAGTGLTTLTVPATIEEIGYGAFRDMKELVSVTIEGDVEIPVYAFRACTKLESVTLNGYNVTFGGKGMIFTNKENGDGSAITMNVKTEEIKARVLAADTASKDYGGYTINVTDTELVQVDDKDGLYRKDSDVEYFVTSAEGLLNLNQMMANKTAGKNVVINLLSDIDFTGKVWTPVDSHADSAFTMKEINGNGHTISNLTVNGQAMFTRFAGFGDVTVKELTFESATVNSTALNSAILTVQSYQNVLLDNVDVKDSLIKGSYKVAPLIATVYNESASTITATVKNCDVSNTTVQGNLDFMVAGLVAFVYESDNDRIVFENCTVTDVTLIANSKGYNAMAAVYCNDGSAAGSFDEVAGVTVTNVIKK